MDSFYIGRLCQNAAGHCSVMVVGPQWLMEDLARLPGIEQTMPAGILLNGVRHVGTVYWLAQGYDPVWVIAQIEAESARLLDWDEMLQTVPLVGRIGGK